MCLISLRLPEGKEGRKEGVAALCWRSESGRRGNGDEPPVTYTDRPGVFYLTLEAEKRAISYHTTMTTTTVTTPSQTPPPLSPHKHHHHYHHHNYHLTKTPPLPLQYRYQYTHTHTHTHTHIPTHTFGSSVVTTSRPVTLQVEVRISITVHSFH